ncbi:multidrug ABC transporter ATP-binding protein [Aerococcus urinaehominis]|uniref:Multidrug ABC transporter ATP-binding protein n=2 Tax=Aerococcus urinaehominis TaxID=128944 RepID=A0A109RH85_9LACT|nr:multidrug ABC transporter ATP-binding protein [Aerococcus urinaehominis]
MARKPVKFSLKDQGQILSLLFNFAKAYWPGFLLALAMMVIVSTVTAVLPMIIQTYLDDYIVTQSVSLRISLIFSSLYLGLTLVQSLATYIQDYSFKLAAENTVASIRNRVYQHVTQLGMRFFDQVSNGTIVSRVTNDTETIKQFWNVFLTFLSGFFNIISIMIAMFSLDQDLAWLFVAFTPIMVLLIYLYQKYSTVIYGRMREALSQLNARLSESISGMGIIQQFGQEDRMRQAFDEVNQTYVVARKAMFAMNALLLNPAISLLEALALVLVLYIFGLQDLQGLAVDIGVLYAFTSYAGSFFRPMGQMMDSLSIFQDGLVSGYRIRDLLAYDAYAPTSRPGSQAKIGQAGLSVKNLNFSYDGDHQVLKDISFEVPAGQTVAFVGQTGSGKSSIINVLMRFYDYQSGEIRIDGHDLRDISMTNLRNQVGLVLQDSFMFYGSVADNIRLHGDYDDAMVQAAARFVHADGFIEDLPDGYDSQVIEGGAAFSTGQKQLLSFARTILREPSLLILDEATANIDTETEAHIQSGLANMRRGRTTIMIAHRLSTIKDADQIFVLKQGRIIEAGNHDDLIALGGTYYDMYQLQNFTDHLVD